MRARTRSSTPVLTPGLPTSKRRRAVGPVCSLAPRGGLEGKWKSRSPNAGPAPEAVGGEERKDEVLRYGGPLTAADRDQWARFATEYLNPKRRAQLVKLIRDNPSVLRAVQDNYKRLFGVKYTERAKEAQRLEALEAIGHTRSEARALLLSLAPHIDLRGAAATKLRLGGSKLADLFADYPARDRERTLAYLASHRVETPDELRTAATVAPESRQVWNALAKTVLGGDSYYVGEERGIQLKVNLGLPLSRSERDQLTRYELRRRNGQQQKIERDVWRPWLSVGARVNVMMEVEYVGREPGDDLLRYLLNGTVVYDVQNVVAIRIDAETPESNERRKVAEANHKVQLILPYGHTWAYVYSGRTWNPDDEETAKLPPDIRTDNRSFSRMRGCVVLPLNMIDTLVDVLAAGVTVDIKRTTVLPRHTNTETKGGHVPSSSATPQTHKGVGDGEEEEEEEEESESDVEVATEGGERVSRSRIRGLVLRVDRATDTAYGNGTEIKPGKNRCDNSLPRIRVRTLTKPSSELEFVVRTDTMNYGVQDLYMIVHDCVYCRMPLMHSRERGSKHTYTIDLVPTVAALLRDFRERAPPAAANVEVLWRLIEQFI